MEPKNRCMEEQPVLKSIAKAILKPTINVYRKSSNGVILYWRVNASLRYQRLSSKSPVSSVGYHH